MFNKLEKLLLEIKNEDYQLQNLDDKQINEDKPEWVQPEHLFDIDNNAFNDIKVNHLNFCIVFRCYSLKTK